MVGFVVVVVTDDGALYLRNDVDRSHPLHDTVDDIVVVVLIHIGLWDLMMMPYQ